MTFEDVYMQDFSKVVDEFECLRALKGKRCWLRAIGLWYWQQISHKLQSALNKLLDQRWKMKQEKESVSIYASQFCVILRILNTYCNARLLACLQHYKTMTIAILSAWYEGLWRCSNFTYFTLLSSSLVLASSVLFFYYYFTPPRFLYALIKRENLFSS